MASFLDILKRFFSDRRSLTIAGGVVATLIVLTVGGLVLFGGDEGSTEAGESSTTAPTTTEAASTTAAPTTTTAAETTTTTTRPAGPAVTVRVSFEGTFDTPDANHQAVRDFYGWLGDREGVEPPPMDPELGAYLADVVVPADVDLEGRFVGANLPEMEQGLVIGVATVGDEDVVLLVKHDEEPWTIVGAKLTGFGKDPWYGPEMRHVMIIGTDARAGYDQRVFRGDSLHVLTSNISEGGGSIVGFPRDSWVEGPYGFDKFTHINALAEEGPAATTDVARTLSGLPVEGYIVTGFQGFRGMVDDFGGVPVNVPFAMADDKSDAYLSAGQQWLMGFDALAFSRNRTIPGGDFTRSYHHGLVIQGGLVAAQDAGIEMMPFFLKVLMARTWTDLTPEQLITVAAGAYELDPDLVGNVVLEGSVTTRSGASVVVLDEEFAAEVWSDVADDGMLTLPEDG